MAKRVFISSTVFDLLDLRAELKLFIESIGLIPIMSDKLDSEFEVHYDQNSIETCLINLRGSDIVILVLCKRYGPSLLSSGFADYSATHLEYLEAKKQSIPIILFVRDRLEADYNHFDKVRKANKKDKKKLEATRVWLQQDKDSRLYEIIDDHKQLTAGNKNNWYWTFRDSIDIKERLKVELRPEIHKIRLDKIIESGNAPLVTISIDEAKSIPNSPDIRLSLIIENHGIQSAIEPLLLVFKCLNYREVLDQNLHETGDYEIEKIKSLKPLPETIKAFFNVKITPKEIEANVANLVLEIIYKSIYGDNLSDITNLMLNFRNKDAIQVISQYSTKRYINESAYEKIAQ